MAKTKPTIPERIELEYMLAQKRLVKDLSLLTRASLSKRRDSAEQTAFLSLSAPELVRRSTLRIRLAHIGQQIAKQKHAELTEILGRQVPQANQAIIERWMDSETDATLGTVDHWLHEVSRLLEKNNTKDSREDVVNLHTRKDADSALDLLLKLEKEFSQQRASRASAAVLSLNSQLIQDIASRGGSSHYRWETEQDNRVRDWHRSLHGSIQDWDDPPLGGGTKSHERGHPGSGYGCRCISVPIQGYKPPRWGGDFDHGDLDNEARRALLAKSLSSQKRAIPKPPAESEWKPYLKVREYRGRVKPDMVFEQAEDAISTYRLEHGVGYDDSGKLIMRMNGDIDSVEFFPDEMEFLRQHCTLFTHNHPGGNCMLSVPDFLFAASGRFEVRAVVDMSRHRAYAPHRGTHLQITSRAKFGELRYQDAQGIWRMNGRYKAQLEYASNLAWQHADDVYQQALRASRNRADFGMQSWADDMSRIKLHAFFEKALELYNQVGEIYGFKITPFD